MSEVATQVIFSIIVPALVSVATGVFLFERKFKFKELHLERADVIKKLWGMINLCEEGMQEYLMIKTQGLIKKQAERQSEMKNFFYQNSIYFDGSIIEKFDEIFYHLQGGFRGDGNEFYPKLQRLKGDLRQEFQKILGA